MPVRTLAVNVATVVVVVVIGGQGGAQVQVLALEVEPLLEHDLWPENLHRKTRRRRRLSASRRNGDVLATPLSLSLSGPQVLVSRGKRERENGKEFLKGTNRKRRGCREDLSQQILVECVSCRQAASASATPRDDERIERGEAAGSRSPTSAGTLLCFCTTIPAALTLPLMLSSPASPMAPCETDQLPKASSCGRVTTRGCWLRLVGR